MASASPIESPPFPFAAESEQRARRALVEALQRHDVTPPVLPGAIGECVQSLRSQGMSPEAMIITMKAFVRHTALAELNGKGASVSRPLMEKVIEWSILEYYRDR